MDRRNAGYSLIEVSVCVTILFIAAGLAAPGFSGWLADQQGERVAESLLRAVNLARTEAVTRNSVVTYCRSANGQGCGGNWEQGSILFSDYNADRRINGGDVLLRRVEAFRHPVTVRFRSFPNRQYLQMSPLGFTRDQNGSFTICPPDGDARGARQVVISRSGRARLAGDFDGDGIREDSRGDPLACP